MLQFGKNIISACDALQKISVEDIYRATKNPKPETVNIIRRLRIIRNIDRKQYQVLKKQLPYLVCGIFNPHFRKTENFARISYFMLDIDNFSDKNLILSNLRKEVEADDRVVMCFTSPSEDGLKVLFKLSEPCYDAGLYSMFYKIFSMKFSIQHHLEQVIDNKTCDVARACFISMDPDAYYNPLATTVNIKSFLDIDNPTHLFDTKRELALSEKEKKQSDVNEIVENAQEKEKPVDVGDDVISNIKSILNPNSKIKREKAAIYVPEQLNDIMSDLQKYISQTGTTITDIINIQYGKKMKFKVGMRLAEVNLFYGKKGFSVVKSPRTGTNDELNTMMADLIQTYLNENIL